MGFDRYRDGQLHVRERLDESQSVVVAAPAAAAVLESAVGGQADPIALLREENRGLREQLNQARVAMRTLASVSVALARMAAEEAGPLDRELLIPRDLYDRLAGSEVGVSEDGERNVIVKIRDNLEHPVWEGR